MRKGLIRYVNGAAATMLMPVRVVDGDSGDEVAHCEEKRYIHIYRAALEQRQGTRCAGAGRCLDLGEKGAAAAALRRSMVLEAVGC